MGANSSLLERPPTAATAPRRRTRQRLSIAFAVIGLSGLVTLGAGAWVHDQPGHDRHLIVHGVESL